MQISSEGTENNICVLADRRGCVLFGGDAYGRVSAYVYTIQTLFCILLIIILFTHRPKKSGELTVKDMYLIYSGSVLT